jgi:hypothetical protein
MFRTTSPPAGAQSPTHSLMGLGGGLRRLRASDELLGSITARTGQLGANCSLHIKGKFKLTLPIIPTPSSVVNSCYRMTQLFENY